ncbi:MAG: DUF3473 domain-containing protein [Thermodesulfobacteria bacterium]|nr:DUF3473 domain-containing protein [Thermodesulfobacteriota bacterium]
MEDWFQVENLRKQFPRSSWNTNLIRVEHPTRALLTLFDKHNIKATFFVLGWLAERVPELVNLVHSHGHEIASHGYGHELCHNLSKDELLKDLERGKEVLEGIIRGTVKGYRAPSFSINENLVSLLSQTGFVYDSSYNDFSGNKRYGALKGDWVEIRPGVLQNRSEKLFEIPIRNINLLGRSIPWGGGGYFRLIPKGFFSLGVRYILKKNGVFVFYCHPWEFDPDQPRVDGLRIDYRFRHYINLRNNLLKLDSFLDRFSEYNFVTCSELLPEY